ncbi:MBL fold metallo-hydrolase [Vibrio cholerae]|nr:MBL fold metallo-hydrolase [Vibrio cholerae]
MYPAGNGDAFLINSDGANLLVDAGYSSTFNQYILNDLKCLASTGGRLDLLITTHIDADHISGVIRFLLLNGHSTQPNIIPIDEIWHNSLRSITNQGLIGLSSDDVDVLNAICLRGHPPTQDDEDSSISEISARQGSTLAKLINKGGYKWNGADGTKCISVDNTSNKTLPNGSICVIAPRRERLEALVRWWTKEIQVLGYSGAESSENVIDDAFELMCGHLSNENEISPILLSSAPPRTLEDAYLPDNSRTNGSSIATIIVLNGKRFLMLADAWAEDIVAELQKLRAIGHSMIFDVVKVSHHGSLRNTSPDFLDMIDAKVFLFSSNGYKHGHPDFQVLSAIVDRVSPFVRRFYFNYSTPASRALKQYCSKSHNQFLVFENATDWIDIEEVQNND